MVHVDEHQNGQAIELQLGQTAEICLPENPMTGFRWEVEESGEPICRLVRDVFEPPSGLPGQGGRHRWDVQAARIGTTRIELVYRRPWEGRGTGARTFSLQIQVHP